MKLTSTLALESAMVHVAVACGTSLWEWLPSNQLEPSCIKIVMIKLLFAANWGGLAGCMLDCEFSGPRFESMC